MANKHKTCISYQGSTIKTTTRSYCILARMSKMNDRPLITFCPNGSAYSGHLMQMESISGLFETGLGKPFNSMFSRFTHVVSCIKTSFLFISWKIFHCRICHILSLHLSVGRCLGCLRDGAIMSNAAVTICIQVSVMTYGLSLWGIYPGGALLGHMVTMFNLSRSRHTVSQSGCCFTFYIPTSKVWRF